jgi:hypothetical protein
MINHHTALSVAAALTVSALPGFKAISRLGLLAPADTPQQFAKLMAGNRQRYAQIIGARNISVE